MVIPMEEIITAVRVSSLYHAQTIIKWQLVYYKQLIDRYEFFDFGRFTLQ